MPLLTRRSTLHLGLRSAAATLAAGAALGPLRAVRAETQPLMIGLVHVGPVTDNGWTYSHDLGRAAVEAEYGARVTTRTVENVTPGPDSERVMEALIEEGAGMIINTGSDHQSAVHKVARRHPDVKFEHVVGTEIAPNVATYAGRFHEGRYIQGMVAGRISKTGITGYIGSFPIPEVFQAINAFTLGLRRTRPDGELRVVWINSWYDPAREADAARTLIAQGADVLSQHTDSPAAIEQAEAAGVHAYGLSVDMSAFGPRAHVNAILKNWGPYYVRRVGEVLAGTWEAVDFWGGLETDVVSLTPWNPNLPREVIAEAEQAEAEIKAGTLDPFRGPVLAQDGTVMIADGVIPSDTELRQMRQYVQGVVGTPPG